MKKCENCRKKIKHFWYKIKYKIKSNHKIRTQFLCSVCTDELLEMEPYLFDSIESNNPTHVKNKLKKMGVIT